MPLVFNESNPFGFDGTIAQATSSSATTVNITQTVDIDPQVNAANDNYVYAVFRNKAGDRELVRVTAFTANSITVVRGIAGTAMALLQGDAVYVSNDRKTLIEAIETHAPSGGGGGGGLTQTQVDRRIDLLVKDYAEVGNAAKIPYGDLETVTNLDSQGRSDLDLSDDLTFGDRSDSNKIKRTELREVKAKILEDLPSDDTKLEAVDTDSTINGDGTATDPLSVANPFTNDDEDKLDKLELVQDKAIDSNLETKNMVQQKEVPRPINWQYDNTAGEWQTEEFRANTVGNNHITASVEYAPVGDSGTATDRGRYEITFNVNNAITSVFPGRTIKNMIISLPSDQPPFMVALETDPNVAGGATLRATRVNPSNPTSLPSPSSASPADVAGTIDFMFVEDNTTAYENQWKQRSATLLTETTVQGLINAGVTQLRPNAFTDADESKLDGIEANATADQTGAEIVTALQGLSGNDRLDASAVKNLPTGGGNGGGLSSVATDNTLTGSGTSSDRLKVANPFTQTDEDKLDRLGEGFTVSAVEINPINESGDWAFDRRLGQTPRGSARSDTGDQNRQIVQLEIDRTDTLGVGGLAVSIEGTVTILENYLLKVDDHVLHLDTAVLKENTSNYATFTWNTGNYDDWLTVGTFAKCEVIEPIKTTNYVPDDGVTTAQIADNAVTTAKIADDAVTDAKIAANAVTNQAIAADAVRNAEIQDNAVTITKIADNAVGTAKIADENVTTAKLATNAVTNAKVADNAIDTFELADNAVTETKLADSAVSTRRIATKAVTAAKVSNTGATEGQYMTPNASGDINWADLPLASTGAHVETLVDKVDIGIAITDPDTDRLGVPTYLPQSTLNLTNTSGVFIRRLRIRIAASTITNLGFTSGSPGDQTVTRNDSFTASDLRETSVFVTGGTQEGIKDSQDIYSGSTKIGTIDTYQTRLANGQIGYYASFDSNQQGPASGTATIQVNLELILIQNDTSASSGGGASTFLALTDTPNAFTGQGGKYAPVNALANALEFVDAPSGGGGGTGFTSIVKSQILQTTGTFTTNVEVPDNASIIGFVTWGDPNNNTPNPTTAVKFSFMTGEDYRAAATNTNLTLFDLDSLSQISVHETTLHMRISNLQATRQRITIFTLNAGGGGSSQTLT